MDIFKDGVLVDVNVSFWSGSKILTPEDLGLKESQVAEAYKLGKKLLIPQEVIRSFRAVEGRARRVVEENSFPFPIGHARFIPKKKFIKVLEVLKECQVQYNSLVETLITNYNSYRDQMVPIYQQAAETAFTSQEPSEQTFSIEDREAKKIEFMSLFLARIQSFYPDAESLRNKFSLSWDIYEIAMPKMKKVEDIAIEKAETQRAVAEEEYRVQAQQKIGGFIEEVVNTLRQETVTLCNHVATNIQEGKVVKGQTLNSLRDFVEKFSELNFVGDSRIETQLENLKRDFLDVHTSEQVSETADLQEELKKRLNGIALIASDMTDINSVTGEYRRRIDWE